MKVKVLNSQTLVETQEVDLTLLTMVGGECTIGRSPNSGVVLDSPDVSRLHGKFIFQDGNCYFCDLGSSNGSMVNGKVALTNQRHMLQSGDVIRLGEFVLMIEEISRVPDEELPQTVIGGIDATVTVGWQPIAEFDTSEVASQAPAQASEVPEAMAQAHELESEAFEVTTIQEVTSIQSPESASAASDVTSIQAPEPHEAVTSEVSSQVPEEVSEVSEATYIQSPEPAGPAFPDAVSQALEEVKAVSEVTHTPTSEAVSEMPQTVTPAPEAYEDAGVSEATHIHAPEVVAPAPEVITSVSEAPEQAEVSEETHIPPPVAVSEVSEVITSALTVPETAEVSEVTPVQVVELVGDVPELETPVPETPEKVKLPEIMAQTPEEVSEVREIISDKYIALMAHDSKRSELVQLVAQHKEFFLNCHTVATPSVSEALSQQTGVAISQKTPVVPVGGYQAVASLVGAGDILAVIFLRDFLVTQPGQANEEALLRLCNVNQVLLATNVPTAEAVVNYIKGVVVSS